MSDVNVKQHVAFWRLLAEELGKGTPLVKALDACGRSRACGGLRSAIGAVKERIEAGATLSAALAEQPEAFSGPVAAMVRAGELGGVVDITAQQIADALDAGSCPVPGADADGAEPVRYWRLLGVMLAAGVPALEALEVLARETEDPRLQTATEGLAQAVREGREIASQMRAFPQVFPEEVRAAVARGEADGELDVQASRIADALENGDLSLLGGAVPEADTATAAPVKDYVDALIRRAVDEGASDIHLDPSGDGGAVRFRVDGMLRDVDSPPADSCDAVVARLKSLAGMDVAEHRLPQDGRILAAVGDRDCILRVSTLPLIGGERVCARLLPRTNEQISLDMVMPPETLDTVRGLCHLPNGLLVCAGPAGSGKTTILYAMLREVDREENCVFSIEDPSHFNLDGVRQVEVRPEIGLTYERAARAVLRHDPDVLMIGDLRDVETLDIAVRCAETGHLVMTQLSARTAGGALARLCEMGVPPHLVATTVAGVTCQRLVRCLCDACKKPAGPGDGELPTEARRVAEGIEGAAFHAPVGCDACHGTGYRGRAAIFEVLVMNAEVAGAVVRKAGADGVQKAAIAAGMKTMFLSGVELAAQGKTSLAEVWRVVPFEAPWARQRG